MAALLHLNGTPGIGKSTLAALYAERHPGTLNLDVDTLHRLLGGWRDPETRAHDVLRPVALAMATTHLRGGRDVVLPQFLGRMVGVRAFEQAAHDGGAEFREVVLLQDRDEAVARFHRRVDDSEWGRHNRQVVEQHGGEAFLVAMHEQLLEIIRLRPAAVVVRSEPGAVEETYAALLAALERPGGPDLT